MERRSTRLSAWKTSIVYAVVAGLWIVFSDRLVDLLGMPALHTFKGLAFVVVTSVVLFLYLRRKVANQARLERSLHAAAESRTRLISSVSHDLRQPLQSIALFCALVRRDDHLSPQSHLALDKLGQSVDRMGQLLTSILELARLDLDIVGGKAEAVPLAPLFAELAEEMAPQAEAKRIGLKCLPSSAVVVSDPVLLLTILRNLVANAIRYTNDGTVLVGCRRKGGDVEIGVYDTGPGIDRDKLGLVFEEFYQIDNPARDSSRGLGLGLSIVSRLARLLGHRVEVRSRKGRGSAFCIVVPRLPGQAWTGRVGKTDECPEG